MNLRELADRYGTPLFAYDLDRVTAARQALLGALPRGFEVLYAIKANPHPDVARAVRVGAGHACQAEISSSGELAAALDAGFPAAGCLYTGPGKTDAELDEAISHGVRRFSVESLTDLRHVGAAAWRRAVTADCLIRVNSVAPAAATGMRMMGRPSQFGLDSETLPETMRQLTTVQGARVTGAHFYTMSNAKDEASLLTEFAQAIELAAQLEREAGLPLEYLDIGGGFASPYAVPGERAGYEKLRPELERLLDLHLPRWRTGSPRLGCESGRYLVGGSGFLLCRVVNIKNSRGRKFIILDVGINAVGGLSGIGRLLPAAVRPAGPALHGSAPGGPAPGDVASLVGPLCTPGDVLARDVGIPPLAAGDVVTIPNVGAYGLTASLLGFLGGPAPAEVAVRGSTVVSVSRLEIRRAYAPARAAAG